jgi:tetratricopeptide (TPR) repeat protein
MRKAGKVAVGAFVLAALLLLLLPAATAQQGYTISATTTTMAPQTGTQITIDVNVSNTAHAVVQRLVVAVYIYPASANPPETPVQQVITSLAIGKSQTVSVPFTPSKAGAHSVTVKLYNGSISNQFFIDEASFSEVFTAKAAPTPPTQGPPMMLIIGAIVGVIIVVVIIVLIKRKSNKKDQPVQPVYTGPVEPEKIQGKFPKDYYKFRREKLARLKPVGLTAGGTCILGNPKTETEEEQGTVAENKKVCPKCCLPQERTWKNCPNCSASNRIKEAQALLDKLKESEGHTSNLEDLLKVAQNALEAKNYDEVETYSHDIIERVKNELRKTEEAKKASEPQSEGGVLQPPKHSGMMESVEPEPVPEKVYNPDETEPTRDYDGSMRTRGYKDASGVHEYSEASSRAQGYEPVGTKETGTTVESYPAYGEVEKSPATEPTPEVKQPTKKEPNPCYKCGQGLKPEWKKCPYCEAVQEGLCPSCGKTIKIKWKVCPHCSADLTVEKPKMACLIDGTELPVNGECPCCKAKSSIEKVSKKIKEAKATGADLTEAEALLGRGELAIKIKNYDKAMGHADKAEEICKAAQLTFQAKKAKDKIEHAETVTKDSAEEGADISVAEKNLVTARMMMNEKRYDEAEQWAEKAALNAEDALKAAMERKEAEEKGIPPPQKKRPLVVGNVKVKPRCPHCQEQVEEDWTMCPYCSRQIKGGLKCPSCGAVVKAGWKVCPACEGQLPG